jgi:hypothetical protein
MYSDLLNDDTIKSNTNAILDVANWCIRQGIVEKGNIGLVGKRSVGVFCTLAFAKRQDMFAGCAIISTDFPRKCDMLSDINSLRSLTKPILVINSANHSRKYQDCIRTYKTSDLRLSFLTYNRTPKDANGAGILEKFFSIIYDAAMEDINGNGYAEFSPLYDGYNIFDK